MDVLRAGAYRIEVEPAGSFACWRVLEGREGLLLAEVTIEGRDPLDMALARRDAITWLCAYLDSVRASLTGDGARAWMKNGGEV